MHAPGGRARSCRRRQLLRPVRPPPHLRYAARRQHADSGRSRSTSRILLQVHGMATGTDVPARRGGPAGDFRHPAARDVRRREPIPEEFSRREVVEVCRPITTVSLTPGTRARQRVGCISARCRAPFQPEIFGALVRSCPPPPRPGRCRRARRSKQVEQHVGGLPRPGAPGTPVRPAPRSTASSFHCASSNSFRRLQVQRKDEVLQAMELAPVAGVA